MRSSRQPGIPLATESQIAMTPPIPPVPEKIEINANGNSMIGKYYPPQGEPLANLVLHGATGVPQRFYRHFAAWAAARGIGVLTYDYHDFAESLTRPLRESKTNFADWCVRDQAAAQAKLAELAPEGPLWVLGHSLGGLGIPFHGYPERTERIITVGAGLGHFTDHPWSYRPLVIAFWFVFGPPLTKLAGYMPGKHLGLGADLPAGVYWQWRKWCTRRVFYACDIGVSLPQPTYEVGVPEVRLCVASDDVLAPSQASYHEFSPEDYGLRSLNHVEFLGRDSAPVWADLLGIATTA